MYVSSITWSVLSELTYLVLTEILFVSYAYYPHFKGEDSEVLIHLFAYGFTTALRQNKD